MNTHDALLAAIAARPEDLTPKLGFIDWNAANPEPIRQRISTVLCFFPTLTCYGFERRPISLHGSSDGPELLRQQHDRRMRLLEEIVPAAAVTAVLATYSHSRRIRRQADATSIRDRVVRTFAHALPSLSYVPLGTVITMALATGLRCRRVPEGAQGASFNLEHNRSRAGSESCLPLQGFDLLFCIDGPARRSRR